MNDQNKHNEEDIIDIEAYAKADKPVPDAKQYQIKVNKEKYTVNHAVVTGREVLTVAGLMPVEQYRLDLKLNGGSTRQVGLEERIDLQEKGVEKFLTLKLDQTEG
jgi:hypothetical protein